MVGVWGKDGLVLEKKHFAQSEGLDMDFTGAELADVIARIDKIKISPQRYTLQFNLNNDFRLIVYSLTPDFFLIVLADKSIITGRLNFYFDLYRNKLIAAL